MVAIANLVWKVERRSMVCVGYRFMRDAD